MKSLFLSAVLVGICVCASVEAMNSNDEVVVSDKEIHELVQIMNEEAKNFSFATQQRLLQQSEEGDKFALNVLKKIISEDLYGGIGYSVARDISEGKFKDEVSKQELMELESVNDALWEIDNGDNVDRIILEGIGKNKWWADVVEDAVAGDEKSFEVTAELLENNYLLDLPYVIADLLSKNQFRNEKMSEIFQKNKKVQKELKKSLKTRIKVIEVR